MASFCRNRENRGMRGDGAEPYPQFSSLLGRGPQSGLHRGKESVRRASQEKHLQPAYGGDAPPGPIL
jgi:hypothetical protein